MPIFEYECKTCEDVFEVLTKSDSQVSCPECGSGEVEKKFSAFASYIKHSSQVAPPCQSNQPGCNLGKCGSGYCGIES